MEITVVVVLIIKMEPGPLAASSILGCRLAPRRWDGGVAVGHMKGFRV